MKKVTRNYIVLGITSVFIAGIAVFIFISDEIGTQNEKSLNERNNSMAELIPSQTKSDTAKVLSHQQNRHGVPIHPTNNKIDNMEPKVLDEQEFNTTDEDSTGMDEIGTRFGEVPHEHNKFANLEIPIQTPATEADSSFREQQIQEVLEQATNSKMSSRMNSLISKQAPVSDRPTELSASDRENIALNEKELRVIFNTTDGYSIDINEISARGGRILYEHENFVAAEVPVDKIEDIVTNVDGIEYARFPHKLIPFDVVSEGVILTGADISHSSGFTGSGVKVAIMDFGFKGLLEAQSMGEIPFSVITRDFTGTGLETQYKHGTACVEIVHDMAPDSELHLLKVSDGLDVFNALDYCIDNNIDIISFSGGFIGSGPGDGTGLIDAKFEQARSNGIFVVSSAGNYSNAIREGDITGKHWKGSFHDSNLDNIHEFIPGDPDSNSNTIKARPDQDEDGNPLTNDLTIIMRWDDWIGGDIDYDIFLFDFSSKALVASSATIQNGSQPPYEIIELDIPESENYWHYYTLEVTRKSGEPAGIELEIFLAGRSYFIPFDKYSAPIATSSSSIIEPADAQGVFAVGAINLGAWTSGPQEDFSSQGPTNAWAGSRARIKPDISGPDGVSGYTYGPFRFFGTSAAAPHVAGVGALLLSTNPFLSADELQATIASRAIDMGPVGKDNVYGWGRLSIISQIIGGSSSGSGCFIATAAYGSRMAKAVNILKEFRDNVLLTNTLGTKLVRMYYNISPPIANYIAKHDGLRSIIRVSLIPLIGISWIALRIGLIPTFGLMFLFGFGLFIITRSRNRLRS